MRGPPSTRPASGTPALQLDELYDHHLITEPAPGRYQLHDLLREYARALAAADGTPTQARASRRAAGELLRPRRRGRQPAHRHLDHGGRARAADHPAGQRSPLATPGEAAAWLEAERPNLHAAVSYAAAQGMPLHAIAIAAAMGGFLRAHGHWDQAAEQYRTALVAAREAGDRPGQAGVLDELGLLQQLTSDYQAATVTLAEAIGLYRELGDLPGQAYALNHLGLVQVDTADYPAAAASHRQALALARDGGRPARGSRVPDRRGHGADDDRRLPGRHRQLRAGAAADAERWRGLRRGRRAVPARHACGG